MVEGGRRKRAMGSHLNFFATSIFDPVVEKVEGCWLSVFNVRPFLSTLSYQPSTSACRGKREKNMRLAGGLGFLIDRALA